MTWRLVYLGERDPYECASYIEAFPTAMKRNLITNTLNIHKWSKPTVFTGRGGSFGDAKQDFRVSSGMVLARGVQDVSHHFFLDKSQFLINIIYRSLEEISRREETTKIQRGIVNTLGVLGLTAVLKEGGNDVLIEGKKVSSVAPPLRDGDVRVIRFNLINDFDFDTVERAIVAKHNMRETMTTLKAKLGREITSEELIDALRLGFEPVLDAEFGDVEYELADAVKEIVAGLRKKYTSEQWIKTGRWSPVKDYWRPT